MGRYLTVHLYASLRRDSGLAEELTRGQGGTGRKSYLSDDVMLDVAIELVERLRNS